MKQITLILSLLLLFSCGKDSDHDVHEVYEYVQYEHNTEFNEIRDSFLLYLRDNSYQALPDYIFTKIEEIPIIWDEYLKSTTLGVCGKVINTEYRFIKINKIVKNSPNIYRIVYHELGHCLLDLPHFQDNNDLMSPKSTIDTFSYFNNAFIGRWLNN